MDFFHNLKGAFRSYQGRHFTSRWVRLVHERISFPRIVGHVLIVATFGIVVIDPLNFFSGFPPQAIAVTPEPLITEEQVKTDTTLSWPVAAPSITQLYYFGHPGIDIQDRANLDIHPIEKRICFQLFPNLLFWKGQDISKTCTFSGHCLSFYHLQISFLELQRTA